MSVTTAHNVEFTSSVNSKKKKLNHCSLIVTNKHLEENLMVCT